MSSMEKINSICPYIKSRSCDERIVVVVSAIGQTTDQLLAQAKNYRQGDSREIDALVSTGEIQSAALFVMALQNLGIKAQSFSGAQLPIKTSGEHGRSRILAIGTKKILKCVENGNIAVVAGFQGINEKGDTTTLGRGGSDTTAVALGLALKCKVEIYSDFDGIYSGDPRKSRYKKCKEINYDDMIAYATAGAKVLALDSAFLAKQGCVKVECKGSLSPNVKGTNLVKMPKPFCAINYNENLCECTLIFASSALNLQKIMSFLLKNINFISINLSKNKLTIVCCQNELNKLSHFLDKIANKI